MKQSFKFIYLLVFVIIIIIVVSMGLFVMRRTGEFTDKVNVGLSDTNEFNNIWLPYKGKQKGSTVRIIINKIITNAQNNSDTPYMLMDIAYKMHGADEYAFIYSTQKLNNINSMKKLSSEIDDKHYYTIDFVYSKSKQISGIIIKYSEGDKVDFKPDEN